MDTQQFTHIYEIDLNDKPIAKYNVTAYTKDNVYTSVGLIFNRMRKSRYLNLKGNKDYKKVRRFVYGTELIAYTFDRTQKVYSIEELVIEIKKANFGKMPEKKLRKLFAIINE